MGALVFPESPFGLRAAPAVAGMKLCPTCKDRPRKVRKSGTMDGYCGPCRRAYDTSWSTAKAACCGCGSPTTPQSRYCSPCHRRINFKNKYGMTPAEREALAITQGHRCAICGTAEAAPGELHIDHDHATGEVRGLLCLNCNFGIGHFRDNPGLLRDALKYLET